MAAVAHLGPGSAGVAIACSDRALATSLAQHLDRLGLDGFAVERGNDAIVASRPRLLFVELQMYEGLELLRTLRRVSAVPTIVLLDDQRTIDPVEAIDAGADDFVVLPCSPRELAAKARAWIRRMESDQVVAIAPQFGVLDLDLHAREVRVSGHLVAVPPREFDLLAFLAQRPGRAFSRSELLARVWSASEAWLGPATVTEHVRRLRHRIEEDPAHPRWLQTVRRIGYRFEPDNAVIPRTTA